MLPSPTAASHPRHRSVQQQGLLEFVTASPLVELPCAPPGFLNALYPRYLHRHIKQTLWPSAPLNPLGALRRFCLCKMTSATLHLLGAGEAEFFVAQDLRASRCCGRIWAVTRPLLWAYIFKQKLIVGALPTSFRSAPKTRFRPWGFRWAVEASPRNRVLSNSADANISRSHSRALGSLKF